MANIKLTARLKAYGKLDISQNILPQATSEDAGKFLGVGNDGSFVLFDNASQSNIDSLFKKSNQESEIGNERKSLIDSMF